MRRVLLLLLLSTAALRVGADDPVGPAEYLKILTDSKLRYNILSTPSKTPVDEMRCGRRDASTRVVAKGDELSLVQWAVKPAAVKLLTEGEVFFQADKYAEAAEKYKQAIEVDPEAAAAYFNYGDALLFGPKDAEAALAQYKKGIALDPTMPIGHFFASTAYVRLGRLADAREAIVKALASHPAYEAIWNIAETNPSFWGAKPVVRYRFDPPAGFLGKKGKNGVDIFGGTDGQWLGYAMCKAVWANEPAFAKRRSADGGWSLEEERACVLNQVFGAYNAAESKLTEQKKSGGGAASEVEEDEVIAAMPALEKHIFEVAQAKLLDGYIAFEIIGQRCPLALSLVQAGLREQVEQYVRKYLVISAQ